MVYMPCSVLYTYNNYNNYNLFIIQNNRNMYYKFKNIINTIYKLFNRKYK